MDPLIQPLIRSYDGVKGRLPGAGLPWLNRIRERGLTALAAGGLPTRRTEEWKYTDLRALTRTEFVPARTVSEDIRSQRVPSLLADEDIAARLVFVDGVFQSALSRTGDLPDGVVLEDLTTALESRPDALEARLDQPNGLASHPLLALNTAYMDEGFVLKVPRGTVVERPIEIVCLGGASPGPIASHPRSLIEIEDGADATVIEYWTSGGAEPYFTNSAVDVRLGANARLRHYRVQAEGPEAYHIATERASLKRDSTYEAFAFSTGARLSRIDAQVQMTEAGARCSFGGAFLVRGSQHCDTTTVIDHRAPHTSCREVFKGVLDDQARGVFQGRIVVRPEAQKTDGQQTCKALLLSDGAEIDAKPELEIYADDVKCSHGATAGDLNKHALFYLRSRGIDDATAHRLLIEAFLADAIDEVSFAPLRSVLGGFVETWMRAAQPTASEDGPEAEGRTGA